MPNYYVNPLIGNDDGAGTISDPWKTALPGSETLFDPGDFVLHSRGSGQIIRSPYRPTFGTNLGLVTFGAYGTGAAPRWQSSFQKDQQTDWENLGGGLWRTYCFDYASGIGPNLISNGAFADGSNGWIRFDTNGAHSIGGVQNREDGGRMMAIQCVTPGAGTTDIRLYTNHGFALEHYTIYRLQFYARLAAGSGPATIPSVDLFQNYSPSKKLGLEQSNQSLALTSEWQLFTRFIHTRRYELENLTLGPGNRLLGLDVTDCRLVIGLGTLNAGAAVNLTGFELCKVGTAPPHYDDVPHDVGHMFIGEYILPWKYLTVGEIARPLGFSSDWDNWGCTVYSDVNPAIVGAIELAMRWNNVLVRVPYLAVDSIDICKGGGNGFSISSCHDIEVTNCEVHHIGGAYLQRDGSRAGERQGDAIQVWESCQNFRAANNLIHDIYDCGITNQGYGAADGGPSFNQTNIVFEDNVLWSCEHTIIILGLDPASNMTDIYYRRNVSIGAGYGWSRQVRQDNYRGFHVISYNMYCQQSNINVVDNVFAYWANGYRLQQLPIDSPNWIMDRNCIIGRPNDWTYVEAVGSGPSSVVTNKYKFSDFAGYVAETGFEANSVEIMSPILPAYGTGRKYSVQQLVGNYSQVLIPAGGWGPACWIIAGSPTTAERP